MNLKQLAQKENKYFAPGHRACAGCGFPTIVRAILKASEDPVVVSSATGCLEVVSTIYPFTAWKVPFVHSAFENSAATISGVEATFQAWKRQNKMDQHVNFVAFGGDGGTYDIGLQSLSGALERGHDFLYVCYDNEAYMNTGIQRSGATPFGASTTTTPAGKKVPGKMQKRKDLARIAAAHNIPYVAQASLSNLVDLTKKAEKAFSIRGPKVLVVLSPCNPGWNVPTDSMLSISKSAVETCFWPLYEVEDGHKYTINYKPREKKPIDEWLKNQRRFAHMLKPGNEWLLQEAQKQVDEEWGKLLKFAGETA
ncbi:MAG TPA: thiamine pyrophosphate-dependent enzyme [bacterium]|nr:thiamine pyrophosphate-dependent enzyme [bacterium]